MHLFDQIILEVNNNEPLYNAIQEYIVGADREGIPLDPVIIRGWCAEYINANNLQNYTVDRWRNLNWENITRIAEEELRRD